MTPLNLHKLHQRLGARFTEVNGQEVVADYGDPLAEHAALRDAVGVLDLSFRSRLVLSGGDRRRFLNGQVTNNVKDLAVGQGCYAAVVTAKGRLESDLNIYCLEHELLLDFEPGLAATVTRRFEKYVIADDVQVIDAAPAYGLLSIQGPKAAVVVSQLDAGLSANEPSLTRLSTTLPHPMGEGGGERILSFVSAHSDLLGEIYLMRHPRTGSAGFDWFMPTPSLETALERLIAAARAAGGGPCGWESLETARIEAGIPRYGVDMDESNLAPEAGIEPRAISYTKGCYIGQEVIARIRTYGQVTKTLCGLRLPDEVKALPRRGDKLYRGDQEAGYVTSAVASPTFQANLALGYVRREANRLGSELTLGTPDGEGRARIVAVPFQRERLAAS